MTRAAIYCRISRDRIGAGLGVERQEQDCRELAEKLGLAVVGIYVDNDLSAYSGKPRPEYLRLLADLEAGLVDVVLAWHTDRLHRSPTELEAYISASEKGGVPTHTVKAGPIDLATPSGRLVARQLGAVARYEVEHAIERQQRAKEQAAVAGKWGGGRRPYGFEPDGVTVRADEARIVAEATDNILLGSSLRGQAKRINDAGATTSTGRSWTPTELKKVLVRPRNAGLREHRGEVIGKAEWEPIVAEEKWRAVVSLLTDPARRTSTSGARKWLLSGIARCGVCGETLIVQMVARGYGSAPTYTCREKKCVGRSAAELDRFVSLVAVERLNRPDTRKLMQPASPGVDLVALRAEETNLQQRLDELADNLDLDERTLARRSQRLRERLEEIAAQKAEAGRGSALSGVADAPDVQAAWDALDLDRKRAVINALMTITVNRAPKGRRRGWRPGESYFDPESVVIE